MAEMNNNQNIPLEMVLRLSDDEWERVGNLVKADEEYKPHQTKENAQLVAKHIGISTQLALDDIRQISDQSDRFYALMTYQFGWFKDLQNNTDEYSKNWESNEWKLFLLIEMKKEGKFN